MLPLLLLFGFHYNTCFDSDVFISNCLLNDDSQLITSSDPAVVDCTQQRVSESAKKSDCEDSVDSDS